MALRLYNSLSKQLEEFTPNTPNHLKMYICGPTVYDSPHIGHARTYISFDVIRRVLTNYFGYDVTYVMNITDIDDKIIQRALERGIPFADLTSKYEKEFFGAMDRLNVQRPDFVTRVTEYIHETVVFVEELESKGLTYVVNGSVYFDLNKYKESFKYNLLRPEVQAVDDDTAVGKKSREDFVLWKASKENEPKYDTKWGKGRPGWHIECSAMSSSIFGDKLDIHAGGVDLAFPHHENEIAQCQGHFGEKWVNFFLHTGHLKISGRKMSKSLKNFLTVDDLLAVASPVTLRMLFLQHLWNKDMDYEVEQLKEAEAVSKKLFNFVSVTESLSKRCDTRSLNKLDSCYLSELNEFNKEVHQALCNNINIPRVISLALQLINSVNTNIKEIHSDVLRLLNRSIVRILQLTGLFEKSEESSSVDGILDILGKFRNEIRKAAKTKSEMKVFFGLSDKLREDLSTLGYVIDDSSDCSVIRKALN